MESFSILIVDDEVHAVRGIEMGVDWDKLSISQVYTANNLVQAQQVMESHDVNLLLSDIDMPEGTGLDLLRWVRKHYTDVEAIFLTCHSDFDYAKEAIQLKSLNYLLKPIDYTELEEAIQKALQKIKRDQHMHEMKASFSQLQKLHQTHMREQFWLDLINRNIHSTINDIKNHLRKHQLKYDIAENFLPILIHIFGVEEKEGLNGEVFNEQDKIYSLKSAVLENIAEYEINAVVITLSSRYLLVIIPEETHLFSEEKLIHNCNKFIEKCNYQLGYELCCYIGKKVPIQEVVEVVEILKEKDRDNVTVINQAIEWEQSGNQSYFIPSIPKDEWIHLLRVGSKDKLISEIKKYIKSWENVELELTRQSLYIFYQDILQIVFYILQGKGLEAKDVFSQDLFEKPDQSLETVDSLQEWTLFIIDLVMDQLHQPKGNHSVVEKVKQYIRENISEHRLTRNDIANYVYFNPDYVGRVFKKETGMSISQYILLQRIEHAKHLLVHTNLSVSEIALQSGYSNFSYFSTLFKKHTNLTPLDFRNWHIESRNNEIQKSVY